MAHVNSSLSDTMSQVLGLMEAFRAFDSDNNGFITSQELGGILSSLGYKATEEDVRAMMSEGDKDRDGQLSLAEFLDMNTKSMEVENGGILIALKSSLQLLDFNCDDDEVTPEELFDTIESSGAGGISFEDCEAIISAVDGDGDGAVSFHDFKLIVSSLQKD
ncbi:PREDICTED: probable calcium-binding protein CML29 [Tarenaya hassleriana]|uniref:probable calcium-binding protein CML29 n=1 Tax=Tarenaya hassleriana TaxID=28532 RepID=UPI00053C9CE8|nr:PREDICTED: probable calcium-binding protein CML29 [Tarenaya hassleriana]